MKNYGIFICILWIATSIAKVPVFLGLVISYAIFIWFLEPGNGNASKVKNIIISIFISSALLAYLLALNVYPANISVLISASIGYLVVEENALINSKRFIIDFLLQVTKNEKIFTISFFVILVIILVVGSLYSVKVGLSWDELVEQHTFNIMLEAMSNGLKGDPKYFSINAYTDKYYGVGFYFPSYFIHRPFANSISAWLGVSLENAILLSRHMAVFWLFTLSSLYVAGIVYWLTKNKKYSCLVAIAYLLWPYTLGHGMINVKDSPFASVWIICIYYIIKIFSDFLAKKQIRRLDLLALTFSIGWLLSIRIGGILILIPLSLVGLMIIAHCFYSSYETSKCIKTAFIASFKFLKSKFNSIFFYASIPVFFMLACYPIFWQDPFEVFKAIKYMSQHPWNLCTLTNGVCMPGQNVPILYIPLWLIVKEPILVLVGILVTPIVFSKLILKKDYRAIGLMGVLLLSIILIYVLLVARKVVLYDEIRHVLFMAELIFIVGWVAFFLLSARAGFIAIILSIALFSFDNLKIYPYQLSWFNEVARFSEINGKYETDYWGNVLSRLATHVNENQHLYKNVKCVYAAPYHLFSPYLDNQKYRCSGNANGITDKNTPRPFLYARTVRERANLPESCAYVHKEVITLALTSQSINLGELVLCE